MTIDMANLLLALTMLQVKHLAADWLLQPKWMWSNKHIYGHYGGIAHAGLNAIGTAFVVNALYGHFWLVLLVDFVCHYHIDYWKMSINTKEGWTPQDSNFWALLGYDQFLHQMTYIFLLFGVLILNK